MNDTDAILMIPSIPVEGIFKFEDRKLQIYNHNYNL